MIEDSGRKVSVSVSVNPEKIRLSKPFHKTMNHQESYYQNKKIHLALAKKPGR